MHMQRRAGQVGDFADHEVERPGVRRPGLNIPGMPTALDYARQPIKGVTSALLPVARPTGMRRERQLRKHSATAGKTKCQQELSVLSHLTCSLSQSICSVSALTRQFD